MELIKKQKRCVVGIMSGTSVDSIDCVLIEITGSGKSTGIKQLGFIEYPYPEGIKELVLKNSVRGSENIDEICRLNFLLPQIYADAVKSLLESVGVSLSKVDLIGSHGQTIRHLPDKVKMFGYNVGSTLQIADPSVLAKKTGIVTVGDFRPSDVALGGQGAPLVPYFDYLMLCSENRNRALLNIGGISNFTIIKKGSSAGDIIAFDTGPGNMLIDMMMKKLYSKEYDENGETAMMGNVCTEMLDELKKRETFAERKPPKSTGRELYGEDFLSGLFEPYAYLPYPDWIATLANFTAWCIFRNYELHVKDQVEIDQLIVSGGGGKNKAVLLALQQYFGENVRVMLIDELGFSSDAKEAVCFAVLANELISGNTANLPAVTGAEKGTLLGKICFP